MYARHFGLDREPFSIAPDPRYLFMSERHREALAHLLYGVGGGGGFVLLTGEIGAGKSTVCRCFLEQVPAHCRVAYIFNPKLTVHELLQTVCEEFHVPVAARAGGAPTLKDHVDALNHFLLAAHAAGRSSVLIIDEAQNLAPEVLEQLRLLTNLETHERKLLQIVLIGQPELRAMLARPDLEQLAQRVIARYHLDALSEGETLQYVEHRLTVAGLKGSLPFDRKALRRIHHHARGVPRRINLLCDRALLGAYGARRDRADAALVDRAAEEVFGVAGRRGPAGPALRPNPWLVAAGTLGAVALVAGAGWLATRESESRLPADTATGAGAVLPSLGAAASASVAPDAPSLPGGVQAASAEATIAQAGGAAGVQPPAASAAAADADAEPTRPPHAPNAAAPAIVPAVTTAAMANTAEPPGRGVRTPAAAASPIAPAALEGAAAPLDWDAERDADLLFPRVDDSLRALARLWGEDLQEGDTCIAAARLNLQCHRATPPLSLVRTLDRPGVVGLRAGKAGVGHALLVGLQQDAVLLDLPAGRRRLSRMEFGGLWDGRFATLWRSPLGYDGASPRNSLATSLWLEARLREIDGPLAPAPAASAGGAPEHWSARELREALVAFQRARGLEADGRLGALTFMQLNRATHVDEPHLIQGDGRP